MFFDFDLMDSKTISTDWSRRWLTRNSKMSTTVLFEFLLSLINYSLDEQQIQKKNRRRGWKMFDVTRCRLEMDFWMSGGGRASDSVSTRRGMKRRDMGDEEVWRRRHPSRDMTHPQSSHDHRLVILARGEVKVEWGNELFNNFDKRLFSFDNSSSTHKLSLPLPTMLQSLIKPRWKVISMVIY